MQHDWNEEKNRFLKAERGIGFEEIIFYIARGKLLDVIEHPNPRKYPGQRVLVVNVEDYVHLVPFQDRKDIRFLITIYPSRKMTKKYLGER